MKRFFKVLFQVLFFQAGNTVLGRDYEIFCSIFVWFILFSNIACILITLYR